MEHTDFGKKVHYHRKKAGMTQSELAERMNVSQVTIANYERGKRFPKEMTLKELSHSLGVSLDTLLGTMKKKDSGPSVEHRGLDALLQILVYEDIERSWQYLCHWGAEKEYGAEDLFLKVIFPLLVRLGQQWEDGLLLVSQEHLVSEKIRALVDRSTREEIQERGVVTSNKRRWLGVCLPGEEHDLPLYIISKIVNLRGWDTLFLGTRVPLEDLKRMIGLYNPRLVALSATMALEKESRIHYLRELSQMGSQFKLAVGGRGWDESVRESCPSKIRFFTDLKVYLDEFVS